MCGSACRHRKSPEFRHFSTFRRGPGMAPKRASGPKRRLKGAPAPPAGDVDRTQRQWQSATTGHAMTVAVGDGRGFSSLAAAPDGRAPSKCTARSWPVSIFNPDVVGPRRASPPRFNACPTTAPRSIIPGAFPASASRFVQPDACPAASARDRISEREARGWHCSSHRRKPVTSGKRRFAIWLLHWLPRPGRRLKRVALKRIQATRFKSLF